MRELCVYENCVYTRIVCTRELCVHENCVYTRELCVQERVVCT